MNLVRKQLGDVLDSAQAGYACGKRDVNGVIQLRMNNVSTTGRIDLTESIRVPTASLPEQDMMLKSGDILFNNTNSVELVGKTALFDGYPESVTFSNHFSRLRVKPEEAVPEYLVLWLQHLWQKRVFEQICDRWIGQAAVQRKKLLTLQIDVPSLAEQRRIATRLKEQLAAVEAARAAAEAQRKDAKALISAFMREALGPLRACKQARIGDVAKTTSGTTPSRSRRDYWQKPVYPWVKTGEIVFEPIEKTEEAVSDVALKECSLPLLPPGTVLVAMYGQGKTRGQSAVLKIEATTNQACFAVLPNDTFEPEFLQLWLRYCYDELRSQSDARGGNQSNLNGELLRAFEVPLVPRDEQRTIVARLHAGLALGHSIVGSVAAMTADVGCLAPRLLSQAFENGMAAT